MLYIHIYIAPPCLELLQGGAMNAQQCCMNMPDPSYF
jgi:hypothetical protein